MAINSSENCRCYISNTKLCVEGSTHRSWSAGSAGSVGLQQPASSQSLPPEHAPFILACFNKLNLLGICFIFLIKKLKPLLGLAVVERQLVMSSGASTGLLETPARVPECFSAYYILNRGRPGTVPLCSAPLWTRLCLPFPEARVWLAAALKARGAFWCCILWFNTVAQGPGRVMLLSTGSHATAPSPSQKQDWAELETAHLWMGPAFSCFLLPHTHTHGLFLLLASQARDMLSISREPGLLPFCLG